MKILLSSNAPWIPSGYGQQTKFLLQSFIDHGHEVIVDCNFGLQAGTINIDGVKYLSNSDYGNNNIYLYSKAFEPDVVVSLVDWFVLKSEVWGRLEMPWYSWTPIDSNLVDAEGEVYYEVFNDFLNICRVVTMSEFGTKEVNKKGYQPSSQIYHMVDANVFQKLDKKRCKDMAIPNHADYDLIIGMVMGNYDAVGNRKAFDLQFEGLKLFAENNPKIKILLFLHTEMTSRIGGLDLQKILDEIGLEKSIDVIYSPPIRVVEMPYLQEELALLYNCFDIVMNATTAEGFGIPIVEAQSCGVPVLTHNFSAMPELTHYGYSAESDSSKLSVFNTAIKTCIDCGEVERGDHLVGNRKEPSIQDIANGLEIIYHSRNEKDSRDAHDWVADTFNPTVIGNAWEDLINGKRG